MRRFLRDQSGATSIEYALIATLVSVVIVGAATLMGQNLRDTLTHVTTNGFTTSR